MYNKILFGLVALVLVTGVARSFLLQENRTLINQAVPDSGVTEEEVVCTMDAFQCPDGSYVGRTGPGCNFENCPEVVGSRNDIVVPRDIEPEDASRPIGIMVNSPTPNMEIGSGFIINGEAQGSWFFEGSFPVSLKRWDGVIIATGVATPEGDWMKNYAVPFTARLIFASPVILSKVETRSGKLILQKDNPSGLPENADALEIPIRFSP